MQISVLESRHKHSIQMEEVGRGRGWSQRGCDGGGRFGNHQQNQQNQGYTKSQDVAKEEEIREPGGVQEEETVGNKGKVIILILVAFVANQVTLQMTIINDSTTKDMVKEINKGAMHLL